MDKQRLIHLVNHPNQADALDIMNLKSICEEYPYFQAARLLLAKAANTPELVKTAAAFTQDRSILMQIMNSEFDANINLPKTDAIHISSDDINAFEKLSMEEDQDLETTGQDDATISSSIATEESISPEEEIIEPTPSSTPEEISFDSISQELLPNEEEATTEEDSSTIQEAEVPSSEEDDISDYTISKNKEGIPSEDEMLARLQSFVRTREHLRQDSIPEEEEEDEAINFLMKKEDINTSKELSPSQEEEEVPSQKPVRKKLPKPISNKPSALKNAFFDATPSRILPDKSLPKPKGNALLPPASMFNLHQFISGFESKKDSQTYQKKIIERFLQKSPASHKMQEEALTEAPQEDLSQNAAELSGPLAENYAKYLEKKGKYLEAIEIYESLILKNPIKKVYFAKRIDYLRSII
ncbi:hypothetical protein [Algivirga pacifica]|uniref:Tetratricopeptide repeat protein n=1 Tax=Algivirga pacifica TaxID=1162670 RepID=A0ABP9CVF6_9BACT